MSIGHSIISENLILLGLENCHVVGGRVNIPELSGHIKCQVEDHSVNDLWIELLKFSEPKKHS